MYVRIYAPDGYEFHDTLTLAAAETEKANAEGSTTTRRLDDPWEETRRAYSHTIVSSASLRDDEHGWPLTNEDIRGEIAADDPDSDCADVSIYVDSSPLDVRIAASEYC